METEETFDLTDWPTHLTDDQLMSVYWCGDCMNLEECNSVEAEIAKRKLDVNSALLTGES